MYQPESIDQALGLLNEKLEKEGIRIEPTVLGSMALQILSTKDLVKLKIYAYYSRMANKDLEDLKLLNPSIELIDAGIKFIEFQIIHHHGQNELKRHLKELKKVKDHLYAEFS